MTTPLTDGELRALREQAERLRFRVACDPQTVLRLVDEIERLGAENDKLKQILRSIPNMLK